MRRIVGLAVGVALLVAVALLVRLRSSAGRPGARRTIAVVPKGTSHEFWQTVHAGAEAAARARGVDLIWQGPAVESDVAGQVALVEDLIDRHVDALVLAPTHADSLVPAIEKAKAAGIPVVLFDSAASTDDYVSFVATDNDKGGELAAQELGRLLGGKGKVAILATQPGGASTEAREKGFRDAIANQFPGITLVASEYGGSQRDVSLAKALDLLSAQPDLAGFFASNESGTFGVMRALDERGLAGKVHLVGFDAAEDLIAGLRRGTIDALVVQDPFAIGERSVEAAVDTLERKSVPRRIDTGVLVVTQANLSSKEAQARLYPASSPAAELPSRTSGR